MGVFAVLQYLKDYTFDGFNGLAQQHPIMAITASICLLSMAGIPLTGGFFAKYYMLCAGMANGMPMWVLVLAVLMAAIGVYYYFRVIRAMYFGKATHKDTAIAPPSYLLAALVINAITIVVLGFMPHIATIGAK
jgi:NADH-quinone oxidoreductase subunit N